MEATEKEQFELTFWGGLTKSYRRNHPTFKSAQKTALKLLAEMPNRAAHPAIIYGPGLSKDGVTVA